MRPNSCFGIDTSVVRFLAHVVDSLGSIVLADDPNDRDPGFGCGRCLHLQEFLDRRDAVVCACGRVLPRCDPLELAYEFDTTGSFERASRLSLD